MWIDWAVFRAAQHGENDRLEEEQSETRSDSRDAQAALAHLGEQKEVQRDEQSGERDGGSRGSSEDGARANVAGGKKVDGAMRQQQNQQGKKNAAGIEAPGQKQSGSEHGKVIEGQRGRD